VISFEDEGGKLELMILDKDGQVLLSTRMQDAFPDWEIFNGFLNWSPDGRFIAVWIRPRTFDDRKAHLALLDTKSGEMVDYCILGNEILAPIWSQDGSQVAVRSYDEAGQNQVIVLDISKGIAVKFGYREIPVGWMVGDNE
jgi:Tol biopolymer transport system component